MEQRIVCTALKLPEDGIILGVRHFDCFMQNTFQVLEELSIDDEEINPESIIQGFLDNNYQFLTREEAWVVAEKAGQIIRDKDKCVGKLFSEHLY